MKMCMWCMVSKSKSCDSEHFWHGYRWSWLAKLTYAVIQLHVWQVPARGQANAVKFLSQVSFHEEAHASGSDISRDPNIFFFNEVLRYDKQALLLTAACPFCRLYPYVWVNVYGVWWCMCCWHLSHFYFHLTKGSNSREYTADCLNERYEYEYDEQNFKKQQLKMTPASHV